MAKKSCKGDTNGPRTARGSQPRGAQHTAARPGGRPDGGAGNACQQKPATSAAPSPAATEPPPGLDAARHAAAQRRAQGAEVLHKGVFSSLMASALAIDSFFDTGAYRLYLEQIKAEAGNPTDPIEIMLIEQLCMAHFRIAQLHGSAGHAKSIEGIKAYNSATARLWGEFRRTALALRVYQATAPKGKSATRLKLFKAAQ